MVRFSLPCLFLVRCLTISSGSASCPRSCHGPCSGYTPNELSAMMSWFCSQVSKTSYCHLNSQLTCLCSAESTTARPALARRRKPAAFSSGPFPFSFVSRRNISITDRHFFLLNSPTRNSFPPPAAKRAPSRSARTASSARSSPSASSFLSSSFWGWGSEVKPTSCAFSFFVVPCPAKRAKLPTSG